MELLLEILRAAWNVLLDSAIYIILGVAVAGLIKAFLGPETVTRHLGKGRLLPVLKASVLGVPMPLCSCGVLPAAAQIKKQGANNGATMAFLISTPESGVDSIAISYALLDPIMTVVRPVVAAVTATVAGIVENFTGGAPRSEAEAGPPDEAVSCSGGPCSCSAGETGSLDAVYSDGVNSSGVVGRAASGMRYAFTELWGDLAGWFLAGVFLAGVISAAVPDSFIEQYLGGGLLAMLIMLAAGVPMYICATASTPIAASLILKGVSPGAALVFLLAGPATNITSLTVLVKVLGGRGTGVYLATIAAMSVAAGLGLDYLYMYLNMTPAATMGRAAELTPFWLEFGAAILVLGFSARPVGRSLAERFRGLASRLGGRESARENFEDQGHAEMAGPAGSCGCEGACGSQAGFDGGAVFSEAPRSLLSRGMGKGSGGPAPLAPVEQRDGEREGEDEKQDKGAD